MLPLTILLLLILSLIARALIVKSQLPVEKQLAQIVYVKYLGILSLTLGIFGQTVGLYGALLALEKVQVAPNIIYSGIRVSSISTIYGLIIFLLAYTAWILLKFKIERNNDSTES